MITLRAGDSMMSIRKSSIYALRVFSGIVEVHYGQKQVIVLTERTNNTSELKQLCEEFGLTFESQRD